MTTHERAERGSRILRLYSANEAVAPDLAVSELLCDLLLWSWREHVPFPDMLRRAIQVRDLEYLVEFLDQGEE